MFRHYTQDATNKVREFAHALIAFAALSGGVRQDAVPSVEGATAFLARELQQVTAQTYDILHHPIKARTLMPASGNVDPGAETYAYDQFEHFGKAEFVTNFVSDLPKADVRKKRFSYPMRTIGTSYQYTVEDIWRSQMAGKPIDAERAKAARLAIEQKIDDLIAFGDSVMSLRGLAGNTDFTAVSPVTGSWSTSTTAAQIFADLNKLAMASEQATAGLFVSDTLVLPLSVKPLLTVPFSSTDSRTIAQVWLQSQSEGSGSGIRQIEYWNKLNLANAGGTGGRALAYKKDPMILEWLYSFDYREFPNTTGGLVFDISVLAKTGSVAVHYPLACSYMDIQ